MKINLDGAQSVNQAKETDETFDLTAKKQEVIGMWTASELDFGFGYSTASMIRVDCYRQPVYSLILDGELSEIMYAIYDAELEPTHWHEG